MRFEAFGTGAGWNRFFTVSRLYVRANCPIFLFFSCFFSASILVTIADGFGGTLALC